MKSTPARTIPMIMGTGMELQEWPSQDDPLRFKRKLYGVGVRVGAMVPCKLASCFQEIGGLGRRDRKCVFPRITLVK